MSCFLSRESDLIVLAALAGGNRAAGAREIGFAGRVR